MGEVISRVKWLARFVTHMVGQGFDEPFATDLASASYGNDWSSMDMSPEEAADEECYAMAADS